MKSLYVKHREFVAYAGFGVGTVLLNFLSYYVCFYILGESNVASNAVAWIVSVTFAFITNKLFVFDSKSFEVGVFIHEALSFYGGRAFTGVIDTLIMYECVDRLQMNGISMKGFVTIIVIALNYVISKKIVFKDDCDNSGAMAR